MIGKLSWDTWGYSRFPQTNLKESVGWIRQYFKVKSDIQQHMEPHCEIRTDHLQMLTSKTKIPLADTIARGHTSTWHALPCCVIASSLLSLLLFLSLSSTFSPFLCPLLPSSLPFSLGRASLYIPGWLRTHELPALSIPQHTHTLLSICWSWVLTWMEKPRSWHEPDTLPYT